MHEPALLLISASVTVAHGRRAWRSRILYIERREDAAPQKISLNYALMTGNLYKAAFDAVRDSNVHDMPL
jgi:hypothetical protein